jgi:thiol:disulfide interchange protein
MSISRLTKETLYLRKEFTEAERLTMATDLAQAHNRMQAIEDEESVMKAQIKERKTAVEQRVGSLSRKLIDGYYMENVLCELRYDFPNVGEVTYVSDGERIEKVRAMTTAERQAELPFEEKTDEQAAVVVEQSQAAVEGFFQQPAEAAFPIAKDLDAVPEATATDNAENPPIETLEPPPAKPSGRKPKGFDKPLNQPDEKW